MCKQSGPEYIGIFSLIVWKNSFVSSPKPWRKECSALVSGSLCYSNHYVINIWYNKYILILTIRVWKSSALGWCGRSRHFPSSNTATIVAHRSRTSRCLQLCYRAQYHIRMCTVPVLSPVLPFPLPPRRGYAINGTLFPPQTPICTSAYCIRSANSHTWSSHLWQNQIA